MSVEISTSEMPGAWIKHHAGDVHVYVNKQSSQVVIGTNKSYKDKINFTDLALVIGKDKCHLQYEKDGNPMEVDISVDVVKECILTMLSYIKAKVVPLPLTFG